MTALFSMLTSVLQIALAILRGYVLTVLWTWFMLTQFPQVPHISIVGAMGLSILGHLFVMRDVGPAELQTYRDMDKEELAVFRLAQTGIGAMSTLTVWLGGYLVHLFM